MSVPSQRADRPARTGGVQSLDRAFELLELMAEAGDEVALSQLAAASGLPVPTIHRIVRTLVASGYVLQLPSRRYALGPRLIGLGESAARTVEALLDELALVRAAGHAVDDGEQETGVRCVAVAVPNRPATAISVSGPAGRVTPDAVTEMLPSLLAAADRLAGRG
jgi:DNA-binding IclR family transcriptional regulator